MGLIWRPGFQFDADASTYIEAVEVADGQALETGVRYAINNFVIGCKADGIWDAIKASCILAGARTLNGALVPLVGTAPTNYNFVAGDYNRKTGLVGNGSTKYLDTNRRLTADPQNSAHVAVWASTFIGSNPLLAHSDWVATGSTGIGFGGSRNRSTSSNTTTAATGLNAVSRNASSGFSWRHGILSGSTTATSEAPPSANYWVFRGFSTSINYYGAHRLAFYSIGEALDLGALDGRVTDLVNAIGAAIP